MLTVDPRFPTFELTGALLADTGAATACSGVSA